jgi:hypothetical protein
VTTTDFATYHQRVREAKDPTTLKRICEELEELCARGALVSDSARLAALLEIARAKVLSFGPDDNAPSSEKPKVPDALDVAISMLEELRSRGKLYQNDVAEKWSRFFEHVR